MVNYELAVDEDGEPFQAPPEVTGWRVRRAADGRGRPLLVHSREGKPLIVRANASHAELLAAAGPGRYRLEAVDEHRCKVEGVPVACTGPLSASEEGLIEGDSGPEIVSSAPVRQRGTYEDVLCQVVSANTRLAEKAIGQLGMMMSGVADLLHAAHNAGITSRVAPLPPPPPLLVESRDMEQADEEQAEEDSSASRIPDVVQLLIRETIDKVVPLIFEKLTSGTGLGGLPLEALLDWRKAAPSTTPTPSVPPMPNAAPASSAPPSSPAASPPVPAVPSSPAAPPPQGSASWPAGAGASLPSTSAGAAPSREPPPGVAPAEMSTSLAPSSSRSHEGDASMINAHVLQVWQGLSPPERARAGQLIAKLTTEERTAWLGELARLTVPEAITRARAVLHAQRPTMPPNPQLPTATPKGEPT